MRGLLARARRRLDPRAAARIRTPPPGSAGRRFNRATAPTYVCRRSDSRAAAPACAPLRPQAARVAGREVEKGKGSADGCVTIGGGEEEMEGRWGRGKVIRLRG